MNSSINALRALTDHYRNEKAEELFSELEQVFFNKDSFLEKVKKFDAVIAKYPEFEPMSEYAFDLLMAHHLEEKQHVEDYFDTKEWMDIEDKTLERGTELLNMLLYLTEAKDSDVEVELEDFLNEFLLIEEDEFQDEHKIYEDLIANVELLEEEPKLMIDTVRRMDINDELKDLLLPIMLFFKSPNKIAGDLDALQPVEMSLYAALVGFWRA